MNKRKPKKFENIIRHTNTKYKVFCMFDTTNAMAGNVDFTPKR